MALSMTLKVTFLLSLVSMDQQYSMPQKRFNVSLMLFILYISLFFRSHIVTSYSAMLFLFVPETW